MKNTFKNILVLGGLSLALAACGKIPKSYQGDFQDTQSGVSLKLESDKGTLSTATHSVSAKADDLKFDALMKGQGGIFIRPSANDKKTMDVYWINPDVSTLQNQNGFVWYKSEVIYTEMDTREDKVNQIHLLHCLDGAVELDSQTQNVEVGCPAGDGTDVTLTRK